MKNKKLFSFLLCLLLVCTLAAGAVQAAVIQPRYVAIRSASCGITSGNQIFASAYPMDSSNNVYLLVTVTKNGAMHGFPIPVAGAGGASYTSPNAVGSGTYTVSVNIKVYTPGGALLEDTNISNTVTV